MFGAGGFALILVYTTMLGATRAGALLVTIAVFNILSKTAELGASTGLIRTLSRQRALGHVHLLRSTTLVALVPVLVIGALLGGALFASSGPLAELFSNGQEAALVAKLLRLLAPFLPFAALYSVVVQGTRGFDSMVAQVAVDKIGKALVLPVAAAASITLGWGVVGAAYAWAGVTLAANLPAFVAFWRLLRRAERHHAPGSGAGRAGRADDEESAEAAQGMGHRGGEAARPAATGLARAFWSFAAPRAFGQMFQVTILWFDTILVSSIIGTRAAGIYAAGTRYLLIGTFTAEAIMQVVGPRISGLLALGRRDEATRVVATATAWQTAITWPTYIVVALFATVLLRVFGPEFTQARTALLCLAASMLVASLFGPSDSVVLMSGRSRQSLGVTFAALAVNLAGNLLFVRTYGISAAGAVWAVTIVLAAVVPAVIAARSLGVRPWSRAVFATAGVAALAVIPPCGVALAVFGETFAGLGVALALAAPLYLVAMSRWGQHIDLDNLVASFRRRTARA